MSYRTWVRLLGATLGMAALAGACQLGVAYGLGILRLTRVLDVTTRDQWTAQLAWVAWLAMMAAVAGAFGGSWLLPRWSPTRPTTGTAIAIAVAAGFGAAIVVPLTMQPARTAQIAGVHPVFVIGLCAGLGALAGVFAAVAVLLAPVSRWSLAALGGVVWLIAIVSVLPSLAPDDPLPAVRLGVFDAGFLSPAATQRTALFTMPAVALIAGALLGWRARRQELPTLTIALAGLPGPALLTVAYLIAGPGSGADRYQVVPYWAAMTATGAGVLGSVLAAVINRPKPLSSEPDIVDTGIFEISGMRGAPSSSPMSGAGAAQPPVAGAAQSPVAGTAQPPVAGAAQSSPVSGAGSVGVPWLGGTTPRITPEPPPERGGSDLEPEPAGFASAKRPRLWGRRRPAAAEAPAELGETEPAPAFPDPADLRRPGPLDDIPATGEERTTHDLSDTAHRAGSSIPGPRPADTGSPATDDLRGSRPAYPGPAGTPTFAEPSSGPAYGDSSSASAYAEPPTYASPSSLPSYADPSGPAAAPAFAAPAGPAAAPPFAASSSTAAASAYTERDGDPGGTPAPATRSESRSESRSGEPVGSPTGRRYPERVVLDDDADEPKPFDAFHRPDPERGLGYGTSNRAGQHAAPEPGPYVPEPATRPLPPGVSQEEPAPARSAGGRLGRSLRPFGRGRTDPAPTGDLDPPAPVQAAAQASVPAAGDDRPSRRARHGAEPEPPADEVVPDENETVKRRGWRRAKPDRPTIDASPAGPSHGSPSPASPSAASPSPTTAASEPGPAADTDAESLDPAEPVNESKRAARKRKKDEEFVDWVSGLGGGGGGSEPR